MGSRVRKIEKRGKIKKTTIPAPICWAQSLLFRFVSIASPRDEGQNVTFWRAVNGGAA